MISAVPLGVRHYLSSLLSDPSLTLRACYQSCSGTVVTYSHSQTPRHNRDKPSRRYLSPEIRRFQVCEGVLDVPLPRATASTMDSSGHARGQVMRVSSLYANGASLRTIGVLVARLILNFARISQCAVTCANVPH